MGLKDLVNDEKMTRPVKCATCRARAELKPKDRAELDEMLADASVLTTHIARALSKAVGFGIQGSGLRLHRKGQCSTGGAA